MIGQRLIERGLLSREGLDQALAEQRRRAVSGQRIRVGELLVEMGSITEAQLAQALEGSGPALSRPHPA